MAMLLRKLWGSVLARAAAPGADPPPGSPRARRAHAQRAEQYQYQYQYHGSLSLGALDAIPTDVLAQILRLLGPLDAARSSAVCRAWRVLAADNGLWAFFLRLGPEPWDLVVFAETHLAAGPSSHPWLYYDNSPQLSFKQIYGLRAVVPGTLIVDGGSGYCKYGWSKYAAPSGRCTTFLEFGNIEAPMYARLRHFFSTIYTSSPGKRASMEDFYEARIDDVDGEKVGMFGVYDDRTFAGPSQARAARAQERQGKKTGSRRGNSPPTSRSRGRSSTLAATGFRW